MAAAGARLPEGMRRTREIAERCGGFRLEDLRPAPPRLPVPAGRGTPTLLAHLAIARGWPSGWIAPERHHAQLGARAPHHRSAGDRRPLPDRLGHLPLRARDGGSSARGGAPPPTRWSATRCASPRWTRSRTTCSSSASSPGAAGAAGHRHRLRRGDARERVLQYVYARYGRGARRHGVHPRGVPRPLRRARRHARARLSRGARGLAGQAARRPHRREHRRRVAGAGDGGALRAIGAGPGGAAGPGAGAAGGAGSRAAAPPRHPPGGFVLSREPLGAWSPSSPPPCRSAP
jgi:hypothetical protein